MESIINGLHDIVSKDAKIAANESFVNSLHDKVSKDTKIVTKDDVNFASAHERWSNIDRKTPTLIVQPATEHDVVVLVRCLLMYGPLSGLKACADLSFSSPSRSKQPMKRTFHAYLQQVATAHGLLSKMA